MKKFLFIFLIIFISMIINSCRSDSEKNTADKNGACNKYVVDTLNAVQLKKIIDNRDGKILFVNFWATWCVPCIEEFPSLVKLAENYKKKDIEFISLSVDLVKEINSAVIPFLKKQKANFPVYIVPEKESERIINLIDSEWNGAIPATAIFDKQGKLIVFLTGLETYESFSKKIDDALKM